MSDISIVELRRYSVHPNRREALIRLFEHELLEPQERAGMMVIGQFRDLDHPDQFIWLRGFPDLGARAASLAAFYEGPVWRAHREAANAAIVDSDRVHLLWPERASFELDGRAAREHAGGAGAGFVVVAIATVDASIGVEDLSAVVDATIAPRVAAAGGTLVAGLVTAPVANDYPRLPVCEDEQVAVWLAACPDIAALHGVTAAARRGADGLPEPEVLRLQPTARSALDGVADRTSGG